MVCLAGGYVWFQANSFLASSPEGEPRDIAIVVKRGATFDSVSRMLKEKGLITDRKKFRMLARYRKFTGSIQAGEFMLNTGWTPDQILERLVHGKPVQYRLHFPEGLAWWNVAKAIERQGFARESDFIQIIHDPIFLQRHGIPFANAEGFLFPETYVLKKPQTMTKASAEEVAGVLVSMFWRKAGEIWQDRRPDNEELRRLLILASLVEKETADPSERERVAGVYANRIRKGMRLQADPTVIYGIGPEFNGNITRKDLRNKSNVYNTYRRNGLPPGPICSPGIAALRAAANPEHHAFLYFVAKGDGTHHFSQTLREHNAAVRKYQLRKGK